MIKIVTGMLLACLGGNVYAQQKATLILFNAHVITLDSNINNASAVAVNDGKIIAVGSNEQVLKLKKKQTTVIDAKGKTLIPGLYDSHLHVIRGGRFFNLELRWDGVTTLKRALTMLKEQALRTPQGQWVRVVGGWNAFQFEEKRLPTLQEINDATGNVPTFILHLYGHAYVNKAGLKALKIDSNTPNTNGGLIEKDATGEPTGLLVAEPNAFILYSTLARLPVLDVAGEINSTQVFMQEMNRLGVTSIMDAGGGFQNYPDDYRIMDTLAKMGKLTVRIPYYLFAQKGGKELEDYNRWMAMVDIEHQHFDGHHTGTEYFVEGGGENLVSSAADFENFDKPRPELSPAMEKQLKEVITLLVKRRWPFRLHATYNESITRFLNVIEEVNKDYPLAGINWFFDHAETVSDENLQRIKRLGGGIAIQHRMAYQGESFVIRYGKTAALQTPPVTKMLAMGIKVGGGTDGTRVASYNPWIGIYWLTTGRTIGGLQLYNKNNVDRITALKIYTQGSASLIQQDNEKGKIATGYVADFALLNQNILTVTDDEIKNTSSLLTILNGIVVYGTNEFETYSTPAIKALPAWSPVNSYGGYQYK